VREDQQLSLLDDLEDDGPEDWAERFRSLPRIPGGDPPPDEEREAA
jgi:hypothetical protein